jgi:hypothetical protein
MPFEGCCSKVKISPKKRGETTKPKGCYMTLRATPKKEVLYFDPDALIKIRVLSFELGIDHHLLVMQIEASLSMKSIHTYRLVRG